MLSLRAHIERPGGFFLTVMLCGAVVAPFGHNLSHVCSLEHEYGHVHGAAVEGVKGESTGMPADFLVEEHTSPHHFACDLCAFSLLTTPVLDQTRAPLLPVRATRHTLRSVASFRSLFYRPIRAPPVVS